LWVVMTKGCSWQRYRFHVARLAMVTHQISCPAHVPVNTNNVTLNRNTHFYSEESSDVFLQNVTLHPNVFPLFNAH
jgi:hypothetical protein